jgi:hypothetical protein
MCCGQTYRRLTPFQFSAAPVSVSRELIQQNAQMREAMTIFHHRIALTPHTTEPLGPQHAGHHPA